MHMHMHMHTHMPMPMPHATCPCHMRMQAGLPAGDPEVAVSLKQRHAHFAINQLMVDDLRAPHAILGAIYRAILGCHLSAYGSSWAAGGRGLALHNLKELRAPHVTGLQPHSMGGVGRRPGYWHDA